ncbi:hypothetical protein J4Q44_G00101760 [Coregonus suidteri]|uniref:Uncharacterized protein n=1 Tax=Coregonus suidteri TaxID=861788 RepID=A0AAN8QW73_9TELE
MTFDITTPDPVDKRLSSSPTKHHYKALFGSKVREEAASMDTFFRNANLFRKKTFGSMLDPQRSQKWLRWTCGKDQILPAFSFVRDSPAHDEGQEEKKIPTSSSPKISTCLTLNSFLE